MGKSIEYKVQEAETIYITNRRKIERTMEELSDEKRIFLRKVEQMTERIRASARNNETVDMSRLTLVNRVLEQAQNEGQHVIKRGLYTLEEKLEENRAQFSQQLARYEEEQKEWKRS